MDLFEDLWGVWSTQIDEGDGTTSHSSVKAALAEAPPINLPPDASISLLDECFANVWADPEGDSTRGISSALPLPFTATDAPSADTDSLTKRGDRSRLSKAVKHKIQRDKAGVSTKDSSAAASLSDEDGTRTTDLGDTIPPTSDVSVSTCFESFLAEMKDFQQNSSQLRTKQHIRRYAEYLHKKYIVLGLENVSDDECAAASKTREVIENIVAKLRARADGQTASAAVASPSPWTCAICTFQNGPCQGTCQTCGRARGRSPVKKAPKPVCVPLISVPARAKKCNKARLERKKDMFLKQKDDYERDERENIADEITELLKTVRATATVISK